MFLSVLAAFAQEAPGPVTAPPEPVTAPVEAANDEKKKRYLVMGAGLFFNAGGTFEGVPSDRSHPNFSGDIPYSGMGGFSPGGGLSLDVRLLDIVGFEVDVIRSQDQALSKYTVNNIEYDFSITQSSWHVPVLFKAQIPTQSISPQIFGGVDAIFPEDPTVDVEPGLAWGIGAKSQPYTVWMFGLGFEGRLPIKGVDLRIPFMIRGAINGNSPNKATDRALYDIRTDGTIVSMQYDTRFQYHAAVTLGLSYFFL